MPLYGKDSGCSARSTINSQHDESRGVIVMREHPDQSTRTSFDGVPGRACFLLCSIGNVPVDSLYQFI